MIIKRFNEVIFYIKMIKIFDDEIISIEIIPEKCVLQIS